jgi:hypothetical protein
MRACMHEQRCGSTGVMQIIDKAAYYSIQTVRWCFDKVTGYGPNMTTEKWLTRVVFLETVAGVPGMVGAMIRHLHSLRLMRRDHGWIHTLLEEVCFFYHDPLSCISRSYHSSLVKVFAVGGTLDQDRERGAGYNACLTAVSCLSVWQIHIVACVLLCEQTCRCTVLMIHYKLLSRNPHGVAMQCEPLRKRLAFLVSEILVPVSAWFPFMFHVT